MKKVLIKAYANENTKKILQKKADKMGLSLSSFMIMCALEKVKEMNK